MRKATHQCEIHARLLGFPTDPCSISLPGLCWPRWKCRSYEESLLSFVSSLCLLSKAGHFEVNGCSDECAPILRGPLLFLCKNGHCCRCALYTHIKRWRLSFSTRQPPFVELESPTVKYLVFCPAPPTPHPHWNTRSALWNEQCWSSVGPQNGPLGDSASQRDLPRRRDWEGCCV